MSLPGIDDPPSGKFGHYLGRGLSDLARRKLRISKRDQANDKFVLAIDTNDIEEALITSDISGYPFTADTSFPQIQHQVLHCSVASCEIFLLQYRLCRSLARNKQPARLFGPCFHLEFGRFCI